MAKKCDILIVSTCYNSHPTLTDKKKGKKSTFHLLNLKCLRLIFSTLTLFSQIISYLVWLANIDCKNVNPTHKKVRSQRARGACCGCVSMAWNLFPSVLAIFIDSLNTMLLHKLSISSQKNVCACDGFMAWSLICVCKT